MATCKDCLHIDVCYMVEHYGFDIDENHQEYDCHQFKDRTKYVEVVRCKDCKHGCAIDSGNYLCNRKMIGKVRPDDFCSFGERRADD